MITTGLSHSCAIINKYRRIFKFFKTMNEHVICWGGGNEYGQIDIPKKYNYKIKLVSVGDEFTCI